MPSFDPEFLKSWSLTKTDWGTIAIIGHWLQASNINSIMNEVQYQCVPDNIT